VKIPMTLHTWTGDHQAVVEYDPPGVVVRVWLERNGDTRDITELIEEDTLAAIESQLLALGTGGLDLEGVDVESHDTGAPDEKPVRREAGE